MIATMTCLVFGFFGGGRGRSSVRKVAGGGPVESLIRMPLQAGSMTDLDLGNDLLETVINASITRSCRR